MNLLVLGPPGSGKGTQAELMSKGFGLYHLDAGQIIREAAEQNPSLSHLVNEEGQLVPDSLVFSLITEKINEEKPDRDGILFDGFPRTVEQYFSLKDWLGQQAKDIDKAISLKISSEESIRRLSARRICKSCGRIWNLVEFPKPPSDSKCICGGELYQREDDKPDAIRERLVIYDRVTKSLIETLDSEGKLIEVGGQHPMNTIFAEISKILKK